MPTRSIAPRTFLIGETMLGPFSLQANSRTATLTIDRTVVGGINSLPETVTIEILVRNASTQELLVGCTLVGGGAEGSSAITLVSETKLRGVAAALIIRTPVVFSASAALVY